VIDTCATCKFWQRVSGDKGRCRRYPAVCAPGGSESRFPPALGSSWCGEHQKSAQAAITERSDKEFAQLQREQADAARIAKEDRAEVDIPSWDAK
jgi:hypothetical protein